MGLFSRLRRDARRILTLFALLTSYVYCLTPNQLHDLNEMNGLHERRPRPADETGSREWRRAPIFTSIILDAPEKLAKRKRIHFLYPEKIIQIMQIMHFVRELTKCKVCGRCPLWTLPAGARGGGRDFRRSRPTPSGLPTHPRRPGYAPGPKRRSRSSRLAEKACKSALEELHNAFSGRQPPAAPILNAPALAGAALQYPRRFQNRDAF